MIKVIALLCLAIYGAIISLLVGLKLELSKKYNVSDAKAGLLFSIFMLGGAVSIIVLSSLVDILGHKIVTIFGFGFTAIALTILSFCKSYKSTLGVYMLMSIGAMCIVSVGNTIPALVLFNGENASAATNLGNAFYGVGAFLVSFYISNLLRNYGYRKTILFFASLVMICAVLSFFAKFPIIESNFNFSDLPYVLSSSFFIIALLANFFGAGVENGIAAWANTYMSRHGSTDKQANSILSFFFIAVLLSRLITATFITPDNTPIVLLVIAVLTVIVITVMISLNTRLSSAICIVTAGLLVGAICPSIFGYMFSKVDPAFHGTAFGILFSLGVAGGSVVPGLIGYTTKKGGLRKGFRINILSAALFGVCTLIMMMFK